MLGANAGDNDACHLDGALIVDDADLADETHVDQAKGCTLSDYVARKFKMTELAFGHVIMVNAKRVGETEHV